MQARWAMDSQVEAATKDFVERLKRSVRVDTVILFGSHASGSAHEGSDIDLAVISRAFDRMSTWERQDLIARATVGRAYRIAPVAFSLSEYREHNPSSFISEVVRTGTVVYQAA